jgi:hypothetical protein
MPPRDQTPERQSDAAPEWTGDPTQETDESAGGADSSPFENLSSDEKEAQNDSSAPDQSA